MKIYRNGDLVIDCGNRTENFTKVTKFHLGQACGGNKKFDGKIDKLRIYNLELTAYEINMLVEE